MMLLEVLYLSFLSGGWSPRRCCLQKHWIESRGGRVVPGQLGIIFNLIDYDNTAK